MRFAAHMLCWRGSRPTARPRSGACAQAIASGAGVEKFREIIANQGGDPHVIDDYSRLAGCAGSA